MSSYGVSSIRLYRSILKEHKRLLPQDLRKLGDTYLRSEFKAHKEVNEEQAKIFYASWSEYLQNLQNGQHGRSLTETEVSQFSEDQIGKLRSLKEETIKSSEDDSK
mmetsp:Transcript_24988/g.32269  ORF Transcript_24988/g.32269 Transcript_24988/m.32269 type:complete len:106 (+) Transcript_24988:160-477(+)